MDEIRISLALGEELIGPAVFVIVVLAFWLSKKGWDSEKIHPGHKVDED